jgi:hypothetical protein
MRSPQTLSEVDRRVVAAWAADCAERVLAVFEADAPGDSRPRALIARARAFARGGLDVADEIRRRFVGGAARDVTAPGAVATARAAGQAAAIPHMGSARAAQPRGIHVLFRASRLLLAGDGLFDDVLMILVGDCEEFLHIPRSWGRWMGSILDGESCFFEEAFHVGGG